MPTTSPDHDGEKWPSSHRSLDSEQHASVQFVALGGAEVVTLDWAHFHGMVTHWEPTDSHRTLSRKELDGLDGAAVRAEALERLGFTEDEMTLLDRPGTMKAPHLRALQHRWEDRLLEVSEAGGRMTDLARALGWSVRGAGQSERMKRTLRRARQRREAASAAA